MRIAAWIFFVLSVSFPAWTLGNLYLYGADALAGGKGLFGMPWFIAYLLCLFMLVVVGGIAAVFAWLAYRKQPLPRRLPGKLEAGFLSMPLVTGVGVIAFVAIENWFYSI